MAPLFTVCRLTAPKTDMRGRSWLWIILSRLLVDTHIDSSIIIDNVLTNHQRSLMNCLYNDNANRRPKHNALSASKQLDPMMTASKYVDGGDCKKMETSKLPEKHMVSC